MTTIGVDAPLQGDALAEVLRLWHWFDTEYAQLGTRASGVPHLTLQGGECADIPRLQTALGEVCHTLAPVELLLDGLGRFDERRVIYFKVVSTPGLAALHAGIQDALVAHCASVAEHYRPEHWVPHVTLAMRGLSPKMFEDAWARLSPLHPRVRGVLSRLRLVSLDASLTYTATLHECELLVPPQLHA